MTASKFLLNPAPTFKALALIPIAGDAPVPVEFTFKHRGRTEYALLVEQIKDMPDEEVVKLIATGWELDDEFNDENIKLLVELRLGAGLAIYRAYGNALQGRKAA